MTASAASTNAPAIDWTRQYGFARGFSYRREAFGGVLYHYAGTQPDPHVYFLDSAFYLDLLDLVPQAPLDAVLSQVTEHFALPSEQVQRVEDFLASLIRKGALVPQ